VFQVLPNDVLGSPPAEVVSFGGGHLGGSVLSYSPGSQANTVGGGVLVTVSLSATGQLTVLPSAATQRTVVFSYRIANEAGFSDATVTIEITRQTPDPL
jgi:hypothetical protein